MPLPRARRVGQASDAQSTPRCCATTHAPGAAAAPPPRLMMMALAVVAAPVAEMASPKPGSRDTALGGPWTHTGPESVGALMTLRRRRWTWPHL
eukprot:scaffold2592_cov395-Prasinococcus_capsulatus_cf.AAC.4